MKQPNWDEYEAALLIETYFKIKRNELKRNVAIENLSRNLRELAKIRGLHIDPIFRNKNGINMRLYEIDGIISEGKYGLKNTSDLFKEMIWLYNNIPSSFNRILKKAKKQLELDGATFEKNNNAIITKSNSVRDKRIFADVYRISPEDYTNILIENVGFSVRTVNGLKTAGINNIEDLLRIDYEKLSSLRNIGAKSVDEVIRYLESLKPFEVFKEDDSFFKLPKSIIENKEYIIKGDFSFIENTEFRSDDIEIIQCYKEAYASLGNRLVNLCINEPLRIIPIMKSLKEFSEKQLYIQNQKDRINRLLNNIPCDRKNNLSIGYINAFSNSLETKNIIKKYYVNDSLLKDIVINQSDCCDLDFTILCKFLNWCCFDVYSEIEKIFDELHSNIKICKILELRSNGATLQETGSKLGITRERVRQIEAKAIRKFSNYQSRNGILMKIAALLNNDVALTSSKLEEYFGQYIVEALYILKNADDASYKYERLIDTFILKNEIISSQQIREYVDRLPDMFSKEQLNEFVAEGMLNNGLIEELILRQIQNDFQCTGSTFHRNRITPTKVYTYILQKYHYDTIKIYDDIELTRFRELIFNEFGNINLPTQNRAISARLADICILCGRGTYRLKKEKYISEKLLDEIHNYIVNSNETVFLTNTLFAIFQDKLEEQGVDNKYYLQGILRNAYENEFCFRRDLVSKDPKITSIYFEITEFIKNYGKPVAKQKIKDQFPGITEIIINMAVQEPSILNYFGEYIHISNLNYTEEEKKYLDNALNELLNKNAFIHSKDIYEYVRQNRSEIISKYYIIYPFCIFSLLEYFFKDKYIFQRPYIANIGTEINRADDILKEYISDVDILDINDLIEYTKELHYTVYSILDFLISYNDMVFIIDSNRIASYNYIGINETICTEIENTIYGEISETIPIRSLSTIYNLPSINVPWTDWLIYSIINKWSNKYEVGTTSNQFKLAIPVIAPKGKLNLENIELTNSIQSRFEINVDNLDDLDSLEIDFFDEEI